MCNTNTISIPANDHISIASEINLNPMANHQIIKNGFNALNAIPAISGPCFELDKTSSFFLNVVRICIAANTKSVIAPKMDIIVLNSGNDSKEKTPIPNKITNGNSTIVWPIAILRPALTPSLNPYDTDAAKRGPGAMTPDADITITNTANSRI